jgi:hypothetical protein
VIAPSRHHRLAWTSGTVARSTLRIKAVFSISTVT